MLKTNHQKFSENWDFFRENPEQFVKFNEEFPGDRLHPGAATQWDCVAVERRSLLLIDPHRMNVQFQATQSVQLAVHEQGVPIHHYLRQPQRLIRALVDPSRTEQLGTDVFRLKMRSLNFMMLNVQPTVDLRLWVGSNGAIYLQSVGCQIRGNDYINQRFHLDLFGQLHAHPPTHPHNATTLAGQADLSVSVDLPPPLWLTPRPILEATGNRLLHSVLSTIKQRLMHQLVADYETWATNPAHQSTTAAMALGNSPTVF